MRTLFRSLPLFGALLVAAPVAPVAAQTSLIGKPAPAFTLPDLQKHPVKLEAYRGKVVLLNFWATWCGPCRVEIPRFMDWQKSYGPQGLQVVGVSIDDDQPPVDAYARKTRLNYPIVMGDAKLGRAYGGVMGVPVTLLIDRKGNVQARYEGATDLNAMETKLKELLR